MVDLTRANPPSAGLLVPGERIRAAVSGEDVLRYEPHSFGSPAARAVLCERWAGRGLSCAPDDMLLTASTSEAYSYLFKLLCDPGEEVLVPTPSYPLFEHLARQEGVRAVPYRLDYDGAWHVDVTSARGAATSRTRAIVVVHPNNPTGSFVKPDELRQLHELGVPLISDEVFLGYPHGSVEPCSAGVDAPGLTFVLDGLSKSAGLPQLKLAWTGMFGPPPRVAEARERLELVADTFLSVGASVQSGIAQLLDVGVDLRRQIRQRLGENLANVRRRVATGPVGALHVEGGWYVTLRLPAVASEEAWVVSLLDERGVLVQPGWFYDMPGGPHVVVSLLTEPAVLNPGLDALWEHVESAVG